jgi:pentatricopeptide repeat protein
MVISSLVINKQMQKAIEMLDVMKNQYRLVPVVQTINHIIQGFAKLEDFDCMDYNI